MSSFTKKHLTHQKAGPILWRLEDFRDLPFYAVAQILSRLTREGVIERLCAKEEQLGFPGRYGGCKPARFQHPVRSPRRGRNQWARKLVGADTVIHTRRPGAWAKLSEQDATLLDFLRRGGKASELSPDQTVQRVVALISEEGRFDRLLGVAATEPPRVRAMFGAIGTYLGKNAAALKRLRAPQVAALISSNRSRICGHLGKGP